MITQHNTGQTVTTTTTAIPLMNTDLLTLTQWLSPAFPVGAFAYSHGLEHVIERGDMPDASSLSQWMRDLLDYGGPRSDVTLLAAAYHDNGENLGMIDAQARAFAASQERLLETVAQGAAFARTVDAVWHTALGPLCYPVAVGRAARLKSLPLDATCDVFLHAVMANLISVAVRLVPLGQTDGQRVLSDLAPVILSASADARQTPLSGLATACFAADIAAMHHETQYSKVFRT